MARSSSYGVDGHDENEEGTREGDDGQGELGVVRAADDEHDELDGEGDEEEEVKLEEHDKDEVGLVHGWEEGSKGRVRHEY